MRKAVVTQVRIADSGNAVCTVEGGDGGYRRTPCSECPWLVRNAGMFPAEAFRLSAPTAYDIAMTTFGCHESGSEKPKTCAGFLLRNAANNLKVRLNISAGLYDPSKLIEPSEQLWASYREMAIGNGVDPNDPALILCRSD